MCADNGSRVAQKRHASWPRPTPGSRGDLLGSPSSKVDLSRVTPTATSCYANLCHNISHEHITKHFPQAFQHCRNAWRIFPNVVTHVVTNGCRHGTLPSSQCPDPTAHRRSFEAKNWLWPFAASWVYWETRNSRCCKRWHQETMLTNLPTH